MALNLIPTAAYHRSAENKTRKIDHQSRQKMKLMIN